VASLHRRTGRDFKVPAPRVAAGSSPKCTSSFTPVQDLSLVFDRQAFQSMIGGGGEAFQRILALFRLGLTDHMLALELAVHEGNLKGLHFHSHTIAGSAANVCASEISKIAARIETLARAGSIAEMPGLLTQLQAACQRFNAVADMTGKD
jgi:HPt (histidine-containing phosphotransfer) domain-containing protein